MMVTDDQRKRGVGLNIKLWKDANGLVHIPYIIDSGSKSVRPSEKNGIF